MSQARPPLILDFDRAVSDIPGAITLALQAWQEKNPFRLPLGTIQTAGNRPARTNAQRLRLCIYRQR